MSMLAHSLAGRELQRWAPESSDELSGILLEPGPAHKGNSSIKWDQFAANKQLFGTQTHYDEDLYTTKLDAGASGISVQEAERLAAEIQGRAASNRHQAEERGAHVDDSGVRLSLCKQCHAHSLIAQLSASAQRCDCKRVKQACSQRVMRLICGML